MILRKSESNQDTRREEREEEEEEKQERIRSWPSVARFVVDPDRHDTAGLGRRENEERIEEAAK